MPRKAGNLSEPDQRLGPEKMAAKFRQQRAKIDWPKIDASLVTLRSCYESEFRPVATAANQGLLTSHEKLQGMRYLDHELGGGVSCLFRLHEILQPGIVQIIARLRTQDQLLHELDALGRPNPYVEQLGVDSIAKLEKHWLPKQLTGIELGRAIEDAFDNCLKKLKEPPRTPNRQAHAVFKLAKHCLTVLVSEFRSARILDVCRECGNVFYPAHARKQFCSRDYEGRNCSVNQRRRRSYRTSRYKKRS